MSSRKIALLAAFIANLIYGINYVVAKGIMPDFLQPRAIILIRVFGASLIFWLISALLPSDKVNRPDLLRIAFASIFGVTINQILFFEGLNLSTPINASIIMVCVPIGVLIFSKLLRKEKLSFVRIVGIMLGTAGAAMLILNGGNPDFSSSTTLGNFFIVINASSYGLYLVLIRPLMMKYNAITIMKWVFLFGLIGVIPFTAHIALQSEWAEIPLNIWLSISYVILFTTVLAYFLNNFSLKRISPTANSSIIYMQPLFATIIALLFGKDNPTFEMLVPVILIFTGVYLVSLQKKKLIVPIQ